MVTAASCLIILTRGDICKYILISYRCRHNHHRHPHHPHHQHHDDENEKDTDEKGGNGMKLLR